MSKLRNGFCHRRFGSRAESEITAQLSRLVLIGLVGVVITTACNRSPEVKSSAEAKITESGPAEITPAGWANPEVTFLRKPGIDLTGPAAGPDGEPDLVLEVTLEPRLLQEIATWEVHANANLGNWTTTPNNKERWWLIKTDLEAEQITEANRSRIRLCFPDNNDPGISKLTLRALQSNGVVLFQQTVSK